MIPVTSDEPAPMTSSKQVLRHHLPQTRSQTPDASLNSDLRTGSICLHVDGNPDDLGPFHDLASKVASCFKPNFNIIETPLPSSSKRTFKKSASSSSLALSSSSSTTSSSTLSLGSKERKDINLRNPVIYSKDEILTNSQNSSYLELEDAHSLRNSTENPDCFRNSTYPAFTVTVFLRHLDADPSERLKPNATPRDQRASSLLKIFKSAPWKLHHSERVDKLKTKIKYGESKINPLSPQTNNIKTSITSNLIDFYHVSPKLPMWSLRQVNHSCEHLRIVVNTSHSLWDDQIKFYSLVLGLEPDLLREDFCLFTVQKDNNNLNYDVQLALKRLPKHSSVDGLKNVRIQIKIKDLGKLVALLPNVCQPISDVLWETSDHQGNRVVFTVCRSRQQQRRRSLCLEDAVYECMTSPFIQNLNNAILQRLESNSKCTQTSPCSLSGDDNNKNNEDCDDKVDEEVVNKTRSKFMINNCDKATKNSDNDDENVYENYFDAKYDDLDVYVNVNCDDDSKGILCNNSSTSNCSDSSNSTSRTYCTLKPPPPRSSTTAAGVKSKRSRKNGSSEGHNQQQRRCVNNIINTPPCLPKNYSTGCMSSSNPNSDIDSIRISPKLSEISNNSKTNGFIVDESNDITSVFKNNNGNKTNGLFILCDDEDEKPDHFQSFSLSSLSSSSLHGEEYCCSVESMRKSLQEDEESLTLTNLSEESGIIVFHDDDGVWCEGDVEGQNCDDEQGHGQNNTTTDNNINVIRPCLRKQNNKNNNNMSSSTSFSDRHRNHNNNNRSNRKVRFSDEIKSFELEPIMDDDSQSRLSSGFESDEQSDDAAEIVGRNKYRYRHRHLHHSSSSSSRTISKHSTSTSFQKGHQDSTESHLRLQGTDNASRGLRTNVCDDSVTRDNSSTLNNYGRTLTESNSNSHHNYSEHRTGVEKRHSDNLPSYSTHRSSKSNNSTHKNNATQNQNRHCVHTSAPSSSSSPSSSSPSSSSVLFRPICPPSYEVALATKRKIQQESLMKSKKNTKPSNCGNLHQRSTNVHADSMKYPHEESLQKDSIKTTTNDIHHQHSHQGNDLYKESIKLHTNQRASLVCSNKQHTDINDSNHEKDVYLKMTHQPSSSKRISETTSNSSHRIHPSSEHNISSIEHSTPESEDNMKYLVNSKSPIINGDLDEHFPPPRQDHDNGGDSNAKDKTSDIATNFTLRFDTCPMSGGQPREEQTGFYV